MPNHAYKKPSLHCANRFSNTLLQTCLFRSKKLSHCLVVVVVVVMVVAVVVKMVVVVVMRIAHLSVLTGYFE